MITEELTIINKELERVKKLDYVLDTNPNIGSKEKTLYDLLDKKALKHISNISIKVSKKQTDKYISLFTAPPEGKNQIKRLKDKYGYIDYSKKNKTKIFNASIQANYSKFINGKLFKLKVNYDNLKLNLEVYNKDFTLIDSKTYWSFKHLMQAYNTRNKYLYLIKAWEKNENNHKMYKYYDYNLYELINFKDFLELITNGTIRVTFHINIIKRGPEKGQIDDKGTNFEIQELDLLKLYRKVL